MILNLLFRFLDQNMKGESKIKSRVLEMTAETLKIAIQIGYPVKDWSINSKLYGKPIRELCNNSDS